MISTNNFDLIDKVFNVEVMRLTHVYIYIFLLFLISINLRLSFYQYNDAELGSLKRNIP